MVLAGKLGKVSGLLTPTEGDTTRRVKDRGSGCSSALVGASLPAGVTED